MDVSVTELVAAYDKNEAAAQITYGNRMLRVTGMVEKINLGPDDEPFVNLAGGQLLPAQLHFGNGFAAQAAQLEKGRQYAFLCTNVSEILGSPMLKDCQLAD